LNYSHCELFLVNVIKGGHQLELQQLFSRYQVAINSIYRGINNTLKNHVHTDITTDQFSILQYIHHQQSCTSTQIATTFGVGKSAVTALINRLDEKKLIERKRDPEDRRIIELSLTEMGEQLVKQTETELYRVIGEKLSHFDKAEIENYIYALERLASLMEE